MGTTGTIIYLVVIVAIFYLLLIRPQQKAKQKRNDMMNGLNIGDEIYTIGGLLGKIVRLDEKEVVLEIAQGVNITVLKTAIGNVKQPDVDEA